MESPLTNEAAIHRLVDDILAYIFFLNATAPDPDDLEHATTVASSQVCKRWRSIALHCRMIWCPIIDYSRHSLKWIETLLDRSHPSSLDFGSRIKTVHLLDRRAMPGPVLELVFNHIDRLRIFNLRVLASFWELVCSRFLRLPAPKLEFVNVIIDSNSTQQFKAAPPLFGNHAPNLQNLQLRGCTIDFTSPILTRLTELYIADPTAFPTVLDWLNILGGMPSLRWLTLVGAISRSAMTNITYPIIHLAALEMLSVDDEFQKSVTLVEHLMVPPRCGLRLRCDDARIGFDQVKLWAIIEKKVNSWAKNVLNRHLDTISHPAMVAVGNTRMLDVGSRGTWDGEAEVAHYKQYIHLLDPVMVIELRLSIPREAFPLFLSLFGLFEPTFFDTTSLNLYIDYYPNDGHEVFLPLVDSFRNFVNLEKMYLMGDSVLEILLPLIQQQSLPNSVLLLPALQSLCLRSVTLGYTSDTLLHVVDFLRWRGEQGFPVQKINFVQSSINRKYLLTHIQESVVEIGDGCYQYDEEEPEDDEDDEEEDDEEEEDEDEDEDDSEDDEEEDEEDSKDDEEEGKEDNN